MLPLFLQFFCYILERFWRCEIVCFPFYYAICITISYVTTIPILHDCYLDVSAVALLPWYELSTGVAPGWRWKKFLSFWTILASSSPLIINNTYELVKCRIKINDMIYQCLKCSFYHEWQKLDSLHSESHSMIIIVGLYY